MAYLGKVKRKFTKVLSAKNRFIQARKISHIIETWVVYIKKKESKKALKSLT